MKYLYSWLKELYPQLPPKNSLEPLLIQLGHDVESIIPVSYPGVIVAEIRALQPHPNADKLSLVTIYDGSTQREIVCGAPHITVGQKVAYATVGATLPSGMTIQPVKIRGIPSDGMLCAEDELGIGPHHTELLSLPAEAVIGQSIDAYVPDNAIIALDITPNRGDVLSHWGLVRDIHAAFGETVLQPHFLIPEYSGETSEKVGLTTLDTNVMAFQLGLVTSQTALPPTPLFWQSRLRLLGQKSINLATDITNYLLFEYGQPLHAYALASLGNAPQIGVRQVRDEENFTGLNGITYRLSPDSLVITNHDQPISLAGLMGGEATKVTTTTQTIVFESACFTPQAIATMSRSLQLTTESSQRFSRGVDPYLSAHVLAHAQALWQSMTGGTAARPLHSSIHPLQAAPVTLTAKRTSAFIGQEFTLSQIKQRLTPLGCTLEEKGSNALIARPPSWRFDLTYREDYDEEIVRLEGLDRVPQKPLPAHVPQGRRTRYWRIEHVKDSLATMGCWEVQTYPFMNASELRLWDTIEEETLALVIPPIENKSFLRPTLKGGLCQAIAVNPETPLLFLFEIGKVFHKNGENLHLALAASSNNVAEVEHFWRNLFERWRLPVSSWMARVQTLSDTMKQAYKIRKTVIMLLELPIEEIISLKLFESPQVTIPDLDKITYTPFARFQSSRRDIAFIVPTNYTPEDITQALKQIHPSIVAVELFDTYQSSALGTDKFSLAYHIYYQSTEKTLQSDEIQSIHHLVESYVKEHYHAIIR